MENNSRHRLHVLRFSLTLCSSELCVLFKPVISQMLVNNLSTELVSMANTCLIEQSLYQADYITDKNSSCLDQFHYILSIYSPLLNITAVLAIQISGMHRCTKLYPNVNILSLQESLQENISHLLLTYFAFPFSFPALSILQSAEPSRAGKISPFPLLFEHCDSDEISSRKDSFYCTLSCPRHQQREENCFLDNTIFFPTQVLVPLL